MTKRDEDHRFGPGHWVTVRETGEHVKVEAWSSIAMAYRVRSRKRGLQLVGQDGLEEICDHPQAHFGKYWARCKAPGCGAPLTPELSTCPQCHAPVCSCGRCQCAGGASKPRSRKKISTKAGEGGQRVVAAGSAGRKK